MNKPKKTSRALWLAGVVVLLPVLYLLSFGPACWWLAKPMPSRVAGLTFYMSDGDKAAHVPRIYWPLGRLASQGPEPVSRAIIWYATVGARTSTIALPTDLSDEAGYRAQWPRWSPVPLQDRTP